MHTDVSPRSVPTSPALGAGLSLEWAAERWLLLPQRALLWPRRRTLVIADAHFGKSATFRAAGMPVPEVIFADLALLTRLVVAHQCTRLVIAGDLLHAAAGRTAAVFDALAEWRTGHTDLDVFLVRGNHDTRAGDPPESLGFRIADEPASDHEDGHIRFVHHPDTAVEPHLATIGGHLHPAAVLSDGVATSLRAPCFWFRTRSAILPAFGRFTGCRAIGATRSDRVFVIGGEAEVAEVQC